MVGGYVVSVPEKHYFPTPQIPTSAETRANQHLVLRLWVIPSNHQIPFFLNVDLHISKSLVA